jgi:hypothetical protein
VAQQQEIRKFDDYLYLVRVAHSRLLAILILSKAVANQKKRYFVLLVVLPIALL